MVKIPRRVCWRLLLGEVIEIEEGIEADQLASLLGALAIVQGEVEADLGVGEGGDVDGGSVFVGGAQDAASFDVLATGTCRWRG